MSTAITDKPRNLDEGGYPCPKGFYCPGGTYTAVACPIGYYGDQEALGFLNECKPCQPGYYGNKVGATECQKCQGATISDLGSSTCQCIGLNRKYLSEIGACVCKTGFTPIDGSSKNDDGYADCEKKIYENCDEEIEARDSNGDCRYKYDCREACDGGVGTVQFNGICQCQNIKTVDEICPHECQTQLPLTYFTSNGTIEIYNPVSNATVTNLAF